MLPKLSWCDFLFERFPEDISYTIIETGILAHDLLSRCQSNVQRNLKYLINSNIYGFLMRVVEKHPVGTEKCVRLNLELLCH